MHANKNIIIIIRASTLTSAITIVIIIRIATLIVMIKLLIRANATCVCDKNRILFCEHLVFGGVSPWSPLALLGLAQFATESTASGI